MSKNLDLPNSYTIETSMWAWFDKESRESVDLDLDSLTKFGHSLSVSISDWLLLMEKQKV